MSFYVHRVNAEDETRRGWIGPIRSRTQAIKEAQAWESCGWHACVVTSDESVRRAVATWQKDADQRLGRKVTR